MRQGGTLTVFSLPAELFTHKIFRFIEPAELLSTETVCKKWQALVSEPSLWHYYSVDLDLGYPSSEGETLPSLDSEIEQYAAEKGWRAAFRELANHCQWNAKDIGTQCTISNRGRTLKCECGSWFLVRAKKPARRNRVNVYHLRFIVHDNVGVGITPDPRERNTLSDNWCYFDDGSLFDHSNNIGNAGGYKERVLTVEIDTILNEVRYCKDGTPSSIKFTGIPDDKPIYLTVSVSSAHIVSFTSAPKNYVRPK